MTSNQQAPLEDFETRKKKLEEVYNPIATKIYGQGQRMPGQGMPGQGMPGQGFPG